MQLLNPLENGSLFLILLKKGVETKSKSSDTHSFEPHHPYETMDGVISHLQDHGATRILLDAETVNMVSKESHVYDRLIRKHNQNGPFLYKTYQMYKQETTLKKDLNDLPNLGVKLVRGAYYDLDKTTGKLLNTPEETHTNYDTHLIRLLEQKVPTLVATHNKQSIELALKYPHAEFAQLYGMSDATTSRIAQSHKAHKYVPYGTFAEMVPYLIRRLYENYGILRYI